MADNTTLDPGTGGDAIRDKDRAGVKTQIVGLDLNIGGAETLMAGAMPVTNTGTFAVQADTELPAAAALADAAANPTTAVIGAFLQCFNGTTWDRLRGDTTNGLDVDVTRLPNVTNGGTFAVQDSQALADNAGFTDGTSKVFPVGLIFDDVAGTALTENDVAAPRIDSKRSQIGVIEDATTRGQRAAVSAAGALKVDNSGVTQPVSGTVTANLAAGTNNIGDVDVLTLPALPAGSNNIGDVDVLTIAAGTNAIGNVGIVPRTTGGLTPHKLVSAATTNATSLKGSAGQVFGYYIYNDGATEVYVKLYNKATAPTVGTDVPVLTLGIPAGGAANLASETGIAFGTGIAYAITTGMADADTGAVALAQVGLNLLYA